MKRCGIRTKLNLFDKMLKPLSPIQTTKNIVLGYGNRLRSDDAVGQVVAERIAAWRVPNVRSLAVTQLTPELALELAEVDLVIFVDAYAANEQQTVKVCPINVASSLATIGHTLEPSTLLAIAQSLYNYHPQAWLIAIPVLNFELGDRLSTLAEQGIVEAIEEIQQLLR
jgi:hydrogenase maturation protease